MSGRRSPLPGHTRLDIPSTSGDATGAKERESASFTPCHPRPQPPGTSLEPTERASAACHPAHQAVSAPVAGGRRAPGATARAHGRRLSDPGDAGLRPGGLRQEPAGQSLGGGEWLRQRAAGGGPRPRSATSSPPSTRPRTSCRSRWPATWRSIPWKSRTSKRSAGLHEGPQALQG